jgi:DDE superfamily endonuclease
LREHLLAHLVCPGRHTVSALITVFGKQFQDWTADYSLYSKERVDETVIFRQVRKEVEALAPAKRPLCLALDDTILRKTGKAIPGAAYRKDPLGPAFNLNLVWAQRMLQLSAAHVDENNDVRMIPIAFKDASTPRKPRKTAPPEAVQLHKEQMKQRNLNALAVQVLRSLQQERSEENAGTAPALHVVVDGSYTNKKILRHLPANTTLIGRIRKDARLSAKPDAPAQATRGPKRIYGDALPTPEQIRQDDKIPWIEVQARVNGKERSFEIKTVGPIRWRAAGEQDLRLVVIRPVGYQKRQGARKSYTQPAYLICTDMNLPLEELIQEYIWRWDIEVNHRDEKTILGVGQAQVRNKHSVGTIPATAVAAYAMLQLAAIKAYGQGGKPTAIPEAKWRRAGKKVRPSTQDLLNELRRELWAQAIRPEQLSDFMHTAREHTKPLKSEPSLYSTLFAATA